MFSRLSAQHSAHFSHSHVHLGRIEAEELGAGTSIQEAGSHCLWPVSSLWLPFSAPCPTPYLPRSGLTIICPLLYSARLCLPSLACRLSLVAQVLPGSTLTKHISALFTVPPMFVVGTILHQTSHTFFLRLTSEVIQLFHY